MIHDVILNTHSFFRIYQTSIYTHIAPLQLNTHTLYLYLSLYLSLSVLLYLSGELGEFGCDFRRSTQYRRNREWCRFLWDYEYRLSGLYRRNWPVCGEGARSGVWRWTDNTAWSRQLTYYETGISEIDESEIESERCICVCEGGYSMGLWRYMELCTERLYLFLTCLPLFFISLLHPTL